MMDYKIINEAVLSGKDVPEYFDKNNKFYDYLLGNNIAYYYSSRLSQKETAYEKKIKEAGKILNGKFIETLKVIERLCRENKIKFLLFKTYKYIPEAVDNDIDLLIKKSDFYRFMEALRKEGFNCIENEPLKGICQRQGYCKVEPRVDSSFHGFTVLEEKELWKNAEQVKVGQKQIYKTTKEVDLLHQLLSILYNPNYLKLYLLLLYKKADKEKLFKLTKDNRINKDLQFIISRLLKSDLKDKKYPLFLNNRDFAGWWFRRIMLNSGLTLYVKIKHILYFFYLKYSYLFFNKLIFRHQWPINFPK